MTRARLTIALSVVRRFACRSAISHSSEGHRTGAKITSANVHWNLFEVYKSIVCEDLLPNWLRNAIRRTMAAVLFLVKETKKWPKSVRKIWNLLFNTAIGTAIGCASSLGSWTDSFALAATSGTKSEIELPRQTKNKPRNIGGHGLRLIKKELVEVAAAIAMSLAASSPKKVWALKIDDVKCKS